MWIWSTNSRVWENPEWVNIEKVNQIPREIVQRFLDSQTTFRDQRLTSIDINRCDVSYIVKSWETIVGFIAGSEWDAGITIKVIYIKDSPKKEEHSQRLVASMMDELLNSWKSYLLTSDRKPVAWLKGALENFAIQNGYPWKNEHDADEEGDEPYYRINISNLRKIPEFTQEEQQAISDILHLSGENKSWEVMRINNDWNIEFTDTERDSLKYWDWSREDMIDYLLKTWRVVLFNWGSEDCWSQGFRIVPSSKRPNPYDLLDIHSPLDLKIEEKSNVIWDRRASIKTLVESLLREDSLLQEKEDILRKIKRNIPSSVLAWKTVEEIITQLNKII